MSETAMTYEQACRETERLSEHLDITNADHIALWLETNMDDSSIAWLAVQMVDAHERAAKHLAMDALIADSADLYDAPASADALGEVERVMEAMRTADGSCYARGTYRDSRRYWEDVATAALSAMSPAWQDTSCLLRSSGLF